MKLLARKWDEVRDEIKREIMKLLARKWDEVRDEIKKQRWGFMQGATLCPLGLDGDKSKYLQNFNVETVRKTRKEMEEIRSLLGNCTVYRGSSLTTFRHNISVPISRFSTR